VCDKGKDDVALADGTAEAYLLVSVTMHFSSFFREYGWKRTMDDQ
jgi:hypothetical protein